MHRRVCTVRESDTVVLLARMMRDEEVGFVPVLDERGAVVGIVTDRDVVVRGCVGADDPRGLPVGSVMSRGAITCAPDDEVEAALHTMRQRRISRILVLDRDGAVAGVLSLSDIAMYDAPSRVGRTLQGIVERKYAF